MSLDILKKKTTVQESYGISFVLFKPLILIVY